VKHLLSRQDMSDYPESIHSDDLALETAKPRLKKPRFYRVLLLNDDYTTMEFVIDVLTTVFHHSEEKAAQIMMHVHQKGAGICGIFTREIAETKVEQVLRYAQESKHPLQCTMEPDSDDDDE
jgi:ATP-dependent Clp protease adaptor protein ClpS